MLKLFFFILGCAVLASGPLAYKPDYKAIIEAKRTHHISMSYLGIMDVNRDNSKR